MRRCVIAVATVAMAVSTAQAERIKDITTIHGARGNVITGFGLVIGLNGTGDGSKMSQRALANYMRNSGNLNLTPSDVNAQNIASVMVTAELGPYSLKGSKLDVTVSVLEKATSLQGGKLLPTPLKGFDGETYAIASGQVIIGGFAATGQASTITKNHTTVGRIPEGAVVEKEELASILIKGEITWMLRNPDFSTAENIRQAINGLYPDSVTRIDEKNIVVEVPQEIERTEIPKFVHSIGVLRVAVDQPATIVINEKTGTIIVGENVGISTVGISHGNLYIITEEQEFVSQPMPFSKTGTTQTIQRTAQTVTEERVPLTVVPKQVSVSELARALNAMGLTPRDLISIFQALKAEGALQAELKII